MAHKKLFGFLFPLHTEIGLFVMPYVTLQGEVSIYFIMVLKLFIVAFRECSKIVDLYPLKFLVLVFSLFSLLWAVHTDKKCLLTISNSTISRGKGLHFISG